MKLLQVLSERRTLGGLDSSESQPWRSASRSEEEQQMGLLNEKDAPFIFLLRFSDACTLQF